MKRYEVRIIGATTSGRWATVAEARTKRAADRCYREWHTTHGCDHAVILMDHKVNREHNPIRSDYSGAEL